MVMLASYVFIVGKMVLFFTAKIILLLIIFIIIEVYLNEFHFLWNSIQRK